MINILLVDDHQLFIDGIKAIFSLEEEVRVTGSCSDLQQLKEAISAISFDVVLMDISMGSSDGAELTTYIKQMLPQVKVIALSMHNEAGSVVRMLRAGANGYILKNASRAELIQAIKLVYSGNIYYSQEIATDLVNKLFKKEWPELLQEQTRLSSREIEIVKLIADGQPNKIIGDQLNITEATVKTHRQRILHKLGVKNTSEMLKYAYTHNLI